MNGSTDKRFIFLALANDRDDTIGYLRNLPDEARRLRDVERDRVTTKLCDRAKTVSPGMES